MQIHFSASLSGSTAEPAGGTSEHTDNSLAGPFFAQIDQVLNPGKGQEETTWAEKPDEQSSSSTVGADSGALILNPVVADGSVPAWAGAAESPLDEEAVVGVPGLKGTVLTAGRAAFRKKAFITDVPMAAPGVVKEVPADPAIAGGAQEFSESAPDLAPEHMQRSRNPSLMNPRLEPSAVKAQSRRGAAQPFPTETSAPNRPGSASASNAAVDGFSWSEVPGSAQSADDSLSRESTVLREKAQEAAQRPGYFVQPGHPGAADSEAGRGTQQNDSAPKIVLPNKTDGSHASEKISNAAGERLEASSPLTSVQSRPAFTDAPPAVPRQGLASHQPGEFVLQLAERIRFQLRDGRGEIRIQLKPDSLGRLEIRAESSLNGVIARIVAESSVVKNYLESSLHLLQQSLQEQGLRIDRIQVSVQDGFGSQSSAGYTPESGHTGHGYHGRGTGRVSAPADSSPASSYGELAVDTLTWISLNPNVRFHTIA